MPERSMLGAAQVDDRVGEPEPEDDERGEAEEAARPRWRDWRLVPLVAALVAAVVLVLGTVGPPLFGRGVFLGTDALSQAYPWRAYEDPALENVADHGPIGDTIDSGVPARTAFFDALRQGELLSWNPYVTGGKPLGSQSSNGVLDPFALTAYGLFPAWYAPAVIKLLTMAAAVGFTFLFCRRLGAGRPAALFGGLAFAGSGFMVMWTNWSQVEVAALIPALFWATERFLQRPRPATAAPVAIALAAALLGNFPAVVLYSLYVLGAYVAVRVAALHGATVRQRLEMLAGSGAAVAAGVGLVAVTLLPFALGLGDLGTGSRAEHPGNHLGIPTLLTTVAPEAFGLSTGGPDEAYFGAANQVEAIAFVGVTTALLALATVALPRLGGTPRGARGVLLVATLVIGWATFVGGDLLQLLQNLPAFDNSFVGRTRSILGFTVSVLAALGLQALAARRWPSTRADWARVFGVVGIAGLVAAAVASRSLDAARAAERAEVLRGALILPAVVGVLAVAAAVAVAVGGRRLAAVGLACLPALLVVESLVLALPLLPNEDRDTYYPTTPGIEELAAAAGEDGRFASENLTMFGSASTAFELRNVGGHAFHTKEWKEALRAIDPTAFRNSPTFAFLGGTSDVMASPMLDRLGVGWFAGSPQTPPPGARTTDRAADAAACDRTVRLADGGSATTTVPLPSGARGFVVRTCAPDVSTADAHLSATIGGSGTAGRVQLPSGSGPAEVTVALPAEDVDEPGGADVRLAFDSGAGAEGGGAVELAADGDGDPIVDVIEPADDGLRLVYADDLRIYERTDAFDRVRWAGRSQTVTDPDERVAQLAAGRVDDDTVVLSHEGPAGSGDPANVEVTRDDPERIDVTVEAEGDGYLVVADSLADGWVATVDGEPADLVAADHATVAVHVPAGEHDVSLRFRPEGQRAGLAVSAVTAAALAAVWVWDARRRGPVSPVSRRSRSSSDR